MSKIEITPDLAKEYYGTQKAHSNYQECIVRYFQTSFHFDGYYMKPLVGNAKAANNTLYDRGELTNPFFVWLIDKVRPGESAVIKNYRRNIYLPKSKNPVHKVYNVLRKILKSPDWAINFPKEHVKDGKAKSSSPIKEEINLEHYLTKVFPFFDSMENWFFQTGLRSMLLDANAMVVVMPLEFPNEENKGDLINPFPYIIYSKDVYEYKEDKLCIFKSPNVHTWKDNKGQIKQSAILLIANENEMYECYKEDGDNIILNLVWEHNLGHMPIWPIGGEVTMFNGNSTVYDSFLEPMMPDLNDMVRRFSDHQAEIVQHIYSTMWYVAQQKCNNCSGSGMLLEKGKQSVCPQCGGDGALNNTPFGSFKIKAPDKSKLENYQMVTPPAGYISKPIDMVQLQETMIKNLSHEALSSVNLEFLGEEPLANNSGKKAAYDQDAGSAYIHKVAFHIVNHVFEPAIFFINRIRYKSLVQSDEKLDEMLPTIHVPENYDLETEQMLEDKLINLKTSNVDSDIISQVKREYIGKKFQDEPDILKMFDLKNEHNPFPSDTLQNVLDKETAGLIEKVKAVIYCNLDDYFQTLEEEHEDLFDLEYDEVEELLNELAQATIEKLSASSNVEALSQIPDAYGMVDETDENGEPTGNKVQKPSPITRVPDKIANKKTGKAGKKSTGLRFA